MANNWLDKYAMGGALPGAVGFMYARTQDPAPSNGPYAKKTKASAQNGSVIKDDRGQWAYPGEVTEIDSNDITMQGVDYPVLGVSDTGDTKMMQPDQDYKFDGEKVTEFPMAQDGGWLDKYQDGGNINKKLKEEAEEFLARQIANRTTMSQYTPKKGEAERLEKEKAQRREENAKPLSRLASNPNAEAFGRNIPDAALFALDVMTLGEGTLALKGLAKPALEAAGKYLTEKTALKNAYKLNPYAFKPTEAMMYRGIGEGGMKDALGSGVFRAKQDVQPIMKGNFDMSKQFSKPYFSPSFETADRYGNGFIAEVPKDATTWGNRYSNRNTWSQIAREDIPIDKGKILKKDWLKGYKQVKQPTSTQRVIRGAIPPPYKGTTLPYDNIGYKEPATGEAAPYLSGDISWRDWNPEIADNPKLLREYANIENKAKESGTWMKNSDGSPFKGTPEQFVQGQSENFKKAFPQGYDKVFRGDRTHYEAIRGKGEEFYGKPIFTTTDKKLAEGFAYKEHTTSPYYNPKIETIEQKLQRMYGPDMTVEKFRIEHPEVAGRILETNDGGLYELAIPKTKNELSFNASNRLHHSLSNPEVYNKLIKEGIIPHKRPELGIFDSDDIGKFIEKKGLDRATIKNVDEGVIGDVIIHNQRPGQYVKSLRGNNGMFDMNNPNIYKALIPAVGVAGIAGASQKKNGGWLNKYK